MSGDEAGRNHGSSVRPVTAPAQLGTVHTSDGVALEAAHAPGPGSGTAPDDLVIVLAHGFTGSRDRPHLRRAARVLTRYAPVVTFSFRGHGGSGGRSTVGDRELLDLAAVVAWARSLGYRRVATVGFSMGGSVVLRHAAEARAEADRAAQAADPADEALAGSGRAAAEAGGAGECSAAQGAHKGRTAARPVAVVSVSAPARWFYRGTAPMRRLHWLVLRPEGRLVGRLGFRTRIHSRDWNPVPPSPAEAVPYIAPVPLLLVHGDRDPYFPLDHPHMLARAADGHAELWIEPGMGHAENAAPDAVLDRIGKWIVRRATVSADDRDLPDG
ncbi:alpha/beta hydrolase family protein [Streptomyces physcomitrii]|uniref:Alpha/beta hydrolase n=1 Tax=Streptomyces physcomitrii TaxID=2724184 RepID=A0ABX1H8M6_9ACTN|nr:alpha/beta hydrolase [Streptomyces physcomitrii]